MTLEQRIFNADRAREVLENEAYQSAFGSIAAEITDQWKKSPARDAEGREKLWLMLSLLNKVEAMLKEMLTDGKMAKQDLQYFQAKEEREREWNASKIQHGTGAL